MKLKNVICFFFKKGKTLFNPLTVFVLGFSIGRRLNPSLKPKSQQAMAILAFPLVISFLKPYASNFTFFRVAKPNAVLFKVPPHPRLSRRYFSRTSASSSVNTSSIQQHSSTNDKDEPKKASVLTFQQAIQRLQVLITTTRITMITLLN